MGRKITDGKAVDVTAPSSTLITKGELYRIDNFTGFAMDTIEATDTERGVALEVTESLWRVLVPAGTCGTRGLYVKWSVNDGTFQDAATDLVDETVAKTVLSVAKVESVRNSDGYATLKLCIC
jgi:hypothetical protein